MGYLKEKEKLLSELRLMGIKDERILKAMELTKRELFVRKEMIEDSYGNFPLPIGQRQTISQPYTVAFMTYLLDIWPGNKILEIGAGSGYNCAVMSLLAGKKGKIYSLELIPELCEFAKQNIKNAKIKNVKVINTDGYFGYKRAAPYDRIIITAGSPFVPKMLLSQLKEGGILIMPRKDENGETMIKVVKQGNSL
jgi:protein-L-isoaspartate(D-aspartate) O-methyltransferase